MVRKSKGLGERHQKILNFISQYQTEHKHPPSIREIGEACDISSAAVVNYYLDQLEKLGYIKRDRKISRGISLSQENPVIQSVEISPKIFISYAREDLVAAKQIYAFLKQNNLTPWLDKLNLLPGQNWESEIQKAIESFCYKKRLYSKRIS